MDFSYCDLSVWGLELTSLDYTRQCKFLATENRKHGNFLQEIASNDWPVSGSPKPSRVFRSKAFPVLVYEEGDDSARLTICRTAIDRNGQWMADITWESLQDLKRQAGYGDRCALEVYPPDQHIVNVANMRHLLVVRDVDTPEFMWRNRR